MDNGLPWVVAFSLATVFGIMMVMMIVAARVGGWLRERWTKRALRREDRQ